MYTKTYRIIILILTIGVSVTMAQPREQHVHEASPGGGTVHDECVYAQPGELRLIHEISPLSLFFLKTRSHGMKWVSSLLDSGLLKELPGIESLKHRFHGLSHAHPVSMNELMLMVDSKPKTTHSCQKLIV